MKFKTKGNLAILQKYWPSLKGIGGAEKATERFSSAIAEEKKIPVCVYTCGDYARGQNLSVKTKFPLSQVYPSGFQLLTYPSMPVIAAAIVKDKKNVSILQIGWGFEHFPNDMIKLLKLKLPTILRTCEIGHFKQLLQEVPKNKKAEYKKILISGIKKVVAISQPLAKEALSFGFSLEQIKVIYSSVPTKVFKPLEVDKSILKKKLGIPEKSFIFLYAGRLTKEKGVDFLLKGWQVFIKKFVNKKSYPYLILIGSLPNKGKISPILKRALHNPFVIYKGVILNENELALFYQTADLFVYPSFHQEGLALSVVEAMSSGLPVLTTDWAAKKTGMRDLIIPKKTGFTFRVYTSLGLAKQLSFALKHSLILPKLGINARNHVLSLGVDNKIAAKRYLRVYQEIINSE